MSRDVFNGLCIRKAEANRIHPRMGAKDINKNDTLRLLTYQEGVFL